MSTQPEPPSDRETFESASRIARPGLARELWDFVRTNRKWWLAPILVVLGLLGLLVLLTSGTSVAPFIYTLF